MSDTDTVEKIEVRTDITEPGMYKVIYCNDDKTTFEFVVDSLVGVFGYDHDDAAQKAQEIHVDGRSPVAVYPFEVAEQKAVEVVLQARKQNYPLQVIVEAE